MAYKHGVYVSEVPTSIIPPVKTEAGLPVIFGTAPIHLASDRAPANKPTLCYTYEEAVKAFGYSDDWKSYTLCEAVYSQFALYNRAPVVLVNVLDPKKHKKDKKNETITFTDGKAIISEPVLLETLVLKTVKAAEPAKQGLTMKPHMTMKNISSSPLFLMAHLRRQPAAWQITPL